MTSSTKRRTELLACKDHHCNRVAWFETETSAEVAAIDSTGSHLIVVILLVLPSYTKMYLIDA